MSIIVWGPPGFIQPDQMNKLRIHFCCEEVVDADFDPYPLSKKQVEEFKEGNILFLTTIDPDINGYHGHYGRVCPHHLALHAAGIDNGNRYFSITHQTASGSALPKAH